MSATPNRSIPRNPRTPALVKCRLETEQEAENVQQEHFAVTLDSPSGEMKLITTCVLGVGGFGKVFGARTPSGESYAVKVSSKKLSDPDMRRLMEEVRIMSRFTSHPNIVKFVTAGLLDNRAYVVMERCLRLSLHDLLGQRELSFPEVLWVGKQLVDTVAYIHSMGCIHRDIKPQNLLFDFEGNLKLTDFGLSSRLSEESPRKTVAGTAIYMAPELAEHYVRMVLQKGGDDKRQLQYGKEVDVWSIGVVLFVILVRQTPYTRIMAAKMPQDKQRKQDELFRAVASATWSWPLNFSADSEFMDLVQRILCPSRANRPTMEEVRRHAVWKRAPLVCPLTLLQTLGVVSRVDTPIKSQKNDNNYTVNTPAPKKTVQQYIEAAAGRIEGAEESERSDLEAEWCGTAGALVYVALIIGDEARERQQICDEQDRTALQMRNQFRTKALTARRSSSLSLVSSNVAAPATARQSRSLRGSSITLVTDDVPRATNLAMDIVQVSPDQIGVRYPGRESSTKWHLREVVSLPRDMTDDMLAAQLCMNGHAMSRLHSAPPGYEGFSCDVCGVDIDVKQSWFRCHKCDYDLCFACATSQRVNDFNLVCATCGKKFPSQAKVRKHSLQCRGPSMSPSPQRAARRDTLEEGFTAANQSSLNLPPQFEAEEPPARRSGRQSGRLSTGRISVGGHTRSPAQFEHQPAAFDALPKKRQPSKTRASVEEQRETTEQARLSTVYELPPDHAKRPRAPCQHEIRTSALEGALPEDQKKDNQTAEGEQQREQPATSRQQPQDEPPTSRQRTEVAEPRPASAEPPALPTNDQKAPVREGTPRSAREGSARSATHVTLRADNAVKPPEAHHAPPMPRRARGAANVDQPPAAPAPIGANAHAVPPPVAPVSVPRIVSPTTPLKAPVQGAVVATVHAPTPQPLTPGTTRTSANAFMALPQTEENRQHFVDEMLNGAWVRFYAFASSDVAVLYYSVQAGRIGAMYLNNGSLATAVLDIHSKLVLLVPKLDDDATAHRREPHPHVQTFYTEEVSVVSMQEAQRTISPILNGILGVVNEINRHRSEGVAPPTMHAAYVHNSDMASVPRETKFAYVRRVFPDPEGTLTLFRLSNLRSQLICTAATIDIRWQSDQRHNIGFKYYVYPDGRVVPFQTDNTGLLAHLERVLSTNYRNQ